MFITIVKKDVPMCPKKAAKPDFPAARVIEEKTFEDFSGKIHFHFVHSKQIPLPKIISDDLLPWQIKVLDNLDYQVCFDGKEVKKELQENLENADKLRDKGYQSSFLTDAIRLHEQKGSVDVPVFFGEARIYFHTENGSGIASTIGLRNEMEDAHEAALILMSLNSIPAEVPYSAVFDGHGGKACSDYAKRAFIAKFAERFNDNSLPFKDKDLRIYNAINLTLADINRAFQGEIEGTTANICLQIGEALWVVNLGDSRAIFVTPDDTFQLSQDQKPEQNRDVIEGRGGAISDDNRILHPLSPYSIAPGRGLGDHHLRGAMCPRPVISKFSLPKNREHCYLVQACDGVFDVASSNQVGELVLSSVERGLSLSQIACNIAIRALGAGSEDNITVLVKKF